MKCVRHFVLRCFRCKQFVSRSWCLSHNQNIVGHGCTQSNQLLRTDSTLPTDKQRVLSSLQCQMTAITTLETVSCLPFVSQLPSIVQNNRLTRAVIWINRYEIVNIFALLNRFDCVGRRHASTNDFCAGHTFTCSKHTLGAIFNT